MAILHFPLLNHPHAPCMATATPHKTKTHPCLDIACPTRVAL